MDRSKLSYTLRIVCGAYLCYLGYELFKGLMEGEDSSVSPAVFIITGIAFIVVGALLIIFSIRDIATGKHIYTAEDEEEENAEGETDEAQLEDKSETAEEDTEYEIPHTMSIAERIKKLSADDDEEDEQN